jgi:hypothetical protein
VSDDSKIIEEVAEWLADEDVDYDGLPGYLGITDARRFATTAVDVLRKAGWCAPGEVPSWMVEVDDGYRGWLDFSWFPPEHKEQAMRMGKRFRFAEDQSTEAVEE